ncbi:MAG: nucleotidyltransferase family protein [Clostridia bacterium]|nr:nucleotidyltransferase family protein [Clostridia bacterium]
MKAVALVAGYATRLYPYTKNFPKSLLSVGGEPILTRLVRQLHTIPAVDEIIVVSNHVFYQHFLDWAEKLNDPSICVLDDGTVSNDDRRGAIGDLAFAIEEKQIDDDILVVAGDNRLDIDFVDFYNTFLEKGKQTIVLGHTYEDKKTLQAFAVAQLDADGKVVDLVEKPEEPKSTLALLALYAYPREIVKLVKKYLDEGNPPDAPGHYPEWLYKNYPVYVCVTDGECIDIGTPQALEEVRRRFGE